MNKILLLCILITLSCSDQPEIFPNNEIEEKDAAFIIQTKNYSNTLPTSIKVNYTSNFTFSFRSFNNSVFDFEGLFNDKYQIDINSVYDSTILNADSTYIGKRSSKTNEFITGIFDTISMNTVIANEIIPIESVKMIVSNVESVNESDIATVIAGDSVLLDNSSRLFVTLRQNYNYGNVDSILTYSHYSRDILLGLNDFLANPSILMTYNIRDSVETRRSMITEDIYKDSTIETDSTRYIFSNSSNIFNDTTIYYDSIRIVKAGSHKYCIRNVIDKEILIDDSNTLKVDWYFNTTKETLFETVIQNVTAWSLDSVAKQDSTGKEYVMRRPEEDFQDTITLVLGGVADTMKYEYYHRRTGHSLGIATSAKQLGKLKDSIFVGNKFIYRDTIEVADTTNLYISHTNFEDYTGILTNENGNFFVFEVDEDDNVIKK